MIKYRIPKTKNLKSIQKMLIIGFWSGLFLIGFTHRLLAGASYKNFLFQILAI